jgi:hypothetical protein
VAIDPAVTSGEEADETGIVVPASVPLDRLRRASSDWRLADTHRWHVPFGCHVKRRQSQIACWIIIGREAMTAIALQSHADILPDTPLTTAQFP